MFTGIIHGTGKITCFPKGRETLLNITPNFTWDEPLKIGESIAVSGVCLTVSQILPQGVFQAYASAETLASSTLTRYPLVNLERALKLCDRLGGHLVTGHVDSIGKVSSLKKKGQSLELMTGFPREIAPYIVAKGSVTLDGVSLTVNTKTASEFSVNLIPTTLETTTLSSLKEGGEVNIETDILGKYVESLLKSRLLEKKEGLTFSQLEQKGF
ncbi:MAG: riboflavin synthase [Deltaproteobacteria bacterium]|jgi:riboflavin synthase|nr:riboflavin synthase [Deltaproteobacteria bacterium]